MSGNPFEASEEPPAEFALPDEVLASLSAGVRCLLFWGAGGMGKTTHLEALAARLEASGLNCVRHHAGAGDAAPDGAWWLLDEAQFWPAGRLRRRVLAALADGRRVALASHLPHLLALRGCGPVRFKLARLGEAGELAALVGPRLRAAGLTVEPAALVRWLRLCGGNREAALRLGYELIEDLGARREVTVAEVEAAARRLRAEAPEVLAWRRLERRHRRPVKET